MILSVRRFLTFLGVLPFVLLMIAYLYSPWSGLQHWLTQYALIILIFLSGMHWGLALTAIRGRIVNFLLISSNVVALLTWLFTYSVMSQFLLLWLCIGFLYQLVIDVYLKKWGMITSEFLNDRIIISGIVIVLLLMSMVGHAVVQ